MKKRMAFLTALVMLLTMTAAFGETAGTPDLYDMYIWKENGRQWVCTAVPIIEGVAVVSAPGLPDSLNGAEIWDGKAFRAVDTVLTVADRTLSVLLFETDGEVPGIAPYDFLEAGKALRTGELLVRSGDWLQSRINRAVYDAASITWKGRDALLLTLSGDTTPGAPLITAEGLLAGIVVAEYAEGFNRYVALTIGEVTNSLQEAAALLEYEDADNRPEGYAVVTDRNLVTFDWSGVTLPERAEGETLYHIVADSESSYLTYIEVSENMTQQTMLLTPGRIYLSGLGVYTKLPDDMPEQLAVTVLPAAEPMTDYQFRSKVLAIAELPADAPDGTMPTAMDEVSETLLRSGRACIYSLSSYVVDSVLNDSTLLITLTAPDGSNYRYESGWVYDPSYMSEDEWYVTLEDTGLLEMLNQSGYPEGVYTLDMYIDGKLADSASFQLIK